MPRKPSGKAKRPQAPAISMERLRDMTEKELLALSSETLKSTYVSLRKAVSSRLRTFEKHGAVPSSKSIRNGMAPMGGREPEELARDITEAMAWVRGSVSTYKGYMKAQDTFRSKMQTAMPDLDLSSVKKMQDFGKFMGEMQERYGEMWHAISEMVRDIYRDTVKLNEDPRQFMRNYDYWAANMAEINKEKNAARSGGRRRSTKLSTYMRQLKRGKIK